MHQLIHCPQTSRMDFAVHFSLGLAALVAVVLSLGATFDFCAHLDQIAERFSGDRSSIVVSAPVESEQNAFTNAAGVAAPLPGPGQAARPAADSPEDAILRRAGPARCTRSMGTTCPV